MAWMQENYIMILAVLLAVSEGIALTPLKSNSIFQLVFNIIKWMNENFKPKPKV